MMNKQIVFIAVFAIVLSVFISYVSSGAPAKSPPAKARAPVKKRNPSLSKNEFHLTCTIVINGNAVPAPPAEEDPATAAARAVHKKNAAAVGKGKGGRRRKRAAGGKVQLICDVDNPEGQEIARRSAKTNKKTAKAPASG